MKIKKQKLTKEVLGGKRKTLLKKFIDEKCSSYKAPERKGTPKGHPIGFGPEKYLASLEALTNIKQQELAKGLGISYTLLRKWRSEKQFKDLVSGHHNEFIQYFNNFILSRINIHYKFYDDLRKKTPEELSCLDYPSYWLEAHREHNVSYEMLADMGGYSNLLMTLLLNHLEDLLKSKSPEMNNLVFFSEIDFIYTAIRHHRGYDDEELKEERSKTEIKVSNILINIATGILSQPRMSINDKKDVIIALKFLTRSEE